MNRGFVFFVEGHQPVLLAAVATYTLRRFSPDMPISLCLGPNSPRWFRRKLSSAEMDWFQIDSLAGGRNHTQRCWNSKPLVHLESPYDVTAVFDCDHVFTAPVQQSLFDNGLKHGLATCHTAVSRLRRQEKQRKRAIKRGRRIARAMGVRPYRQWPVNGGAVVSACPDLLREWFAAIEPISRAVRMVPDEMALGYVLGRRRIPNLSSLHSFTVGNAREPNPLEVDALHFSRGSYDSSQTFKAALAMARRANWLDLRSDGRYKLPHVAGNGSL